MNKIIICRKKPILVLGFIFIFTLVFLAGRVTAQSKTEKKLLKLDKIKASGRLVVGTSPEYPPYEFHLLDDIEGDIIGLDIDIAKEIAKELGVKLEIKTVIFHKLFQALNSEEIDLAIAGLAPSERRKKIVDFSDIYYQAIQNMVIRAQDSDEIIYIRDLRGKTVGTQKGSIQHEMAKKQILGAKFVQKNTVSELIEDLKNKKIDAVILEKPVAESFVFRNKSLVNIECHSGAYDSLLGSAIAIKKGNDDLLMAVNKILNKLKLENKIKEFVEDAKILMNK